MHRRGVVCNGIDDFWGLLRLRLIGMRLSVRYAHRGGEARPEHTKEGASGFYNRAHVHEYTIVDEGRYFTQPPLFTGTFLLREPLARAAYIVLVRGILYLTFLATSCSAHLVLRRAAGREIAFDHLPAPSRPGCCAVLGLR
jgi:hypothetical protein